MLFEKIGYNPSVIIIQTEKNMGITEDRFLQGVLSRDNRPLTDFEQQLFDYFEEANRESRVASRRQDLLREFYEKDVYNKAEIVDNMRQVERERLKHRDKTERGILFENIFEAFILETFSGMKGKKTEDYDDFFNHIDFVLSGKDEKGEDYFLGVDTTTSDYGVKLKEKINAIYRDVASGNLGKVKYFKSEETGRLGLLDFVPRVVVLFDSLALSDLSEKLGAVIEGRENREVVMEAQNDLLLVMFGQIRDQLKELEEQIEQNRISLEESGRTDVPRMRRAVVLAMKKIEEIIQERENKKIPVDDTNREESRPTRRRVIVG